MSRPGFSLTLLGIMALSSVLTSIALAKSDQRVLIAFLVRNKAHSLPYFLRYLELLDMPKDQISLWIRTDHNIDSSSHMLTNWVANMEGQYNSIDYEHDEGDSGFAREQGPLDWTDERLAMVMSLRQGALDAGKQLRVDYIFMLDADVILYNPSTLQQLIAEDKPVVAPLLTVTADRQYANFWSNQSDEIKDGTKRGCFEVPMVESAVLINYKHPQTKRLAYFPPQPGYTGRYVDNNVFANYAQTFGVKMYVLNKFFYGFIDVPMPPTATLEEQREQFLHIHTKNIVDDGRLQKVPYLHPPPLVDEKDKMGFDEIYFINLERREDRKLKMEQCCEELGLDARFFKAVDGESLNVSYLQSLNIRMVPGYLDPYQQRPMTKGEVGCFLSHYSVWKEMLRKKHEKVLIFEDDVRFEPFFRSRFQKVLDEIEQIKLEWDLIYIARRRMDNLPEYFVPNSKHLVMPTYSYWAFSYMLSSKGARKLVRQDPLKKMMAVDEFLPVMFDQHPRTDWMQHFTPRDIQAFAIEPQILFPMRYKREVNHVSDTDGSDVLNFDSKGILHEGKWPGERSEDTIQVRPGKLDPPVFNQRIEL